MGNTAQEEQLVFLFFHALKHVEKGFSYQRNTDTKQVQTIFQKP